MTPEMKRKSVINTITKISVSVNATETKTNLLKSAWKGVPERKINPSPTAILYTMQSELRFN